MQVFLQMYLVLELRGSLWNGLNGIDIPFQL